MAPLQLGYGTSSGAEAAAAHASRLYLLNTQIDHLLLKLDFKNAFNCLWQDKMLEAVCEFAPELFPFVYSAYEKSSLLCGDTVLLSQKGVHQGYSLGPLLFCLTIHPMVLQLKSEFKVFYLDDGTLGGSLPEGLEDLRMLESSALELGLQLNRNKS